MIHVALPDHPGLTQPRTNLNAEMKLIPDFMRDALKIEQHKKYELALLQFLAGPGTKPIIHGYPIYPR